MNKMSLIVALSLTLVCSLAVADSHNNLLRAADPPQTTTQNSQGENQQVVIDITRGLLQISEKVLQNLSSFVPASETATITQVRQHFAQLILQLDTQPDTVLSAKQDEQLESLLTTFGPVLFTAISFCPGTQTRGHYPEMFIGFIITND